jgi:hypothetical protein
MGNIQPISLLRPDFAIEPGGLHRFTTLVGASGVAASGQSEQRGVTEGTFSLSSAVRCGHIPKHVACDLLNNRISRSRQDIRRKRLGPGGQRIFLVRTRLSRRETGPRRGRSTRACCFIANLGRDEKSNVRYYADFMRKPGEDLRTDAPGFVQDQVGTRVVRNSTAGVESIFTDASRCFGRKARKKRKETSHLKEKSSFGQRKSRSLAAPTPVRLTTHKSRHATLSSVVDQFEVGRHSLGGKGREAIVEI